MNLFTWSVFSYILLFFVLSRFLKTPTSLQRLMGFGALWFLLWQSAPKYEMKLFFIALTFAIFFVGWRIGDALDRNKGDAERARSLLKTGALLVLAPLAFFKLIQGIVSPQAIENLLTLRGARMEVGSLAPMGISYFTFRIISYLIEVRRGTIPAVGWWRFFNYVAFWPTVMAGPIERPGAFFAQDETGGRASPEDIRIGLARVASGLFKKLVLGSLFYQIAAPYLILTGNTAEILARWKVWQLWFCVHAYYFYLYLDFAGYSDVAIGLARLFGFRIMENFRWPMLATNVADFWRRWHVSLTGWVTDYVYIPLGGNRGGMEQAARNTIIAMVLVGLWHGFNLHFAAWGLWHALFLIAYRYYRKVYKAGIPNSRWWTLAGWFVTFQIVNLGWIPFVFGFKSSLLIFAKLFGLG